MSGAFELTIPLTGIWLGRHAASVVVEQAGWLGPALLVGVGAGTIVAKSRNRHERAAETASGLLLLLLGAATWFD